MVDSLNRQRARTRARRARQPNEAAPETITPAKPRLRVVASVETPRPAPAAIEDEFDGEDIFVGASGFAFSGDDLPPFDPPDAEDLLAAPEDEEDDDTCEDAPLILTEEEPAPSADEPADDDALLLVAPEEEPLPLTDLEEEELVLETEAAAPPFDEEEDDVPFDPPDDEALPVFVRAPVLDDLLPPPEPAPRAANENREPHPIAKFARAVAQPNHGAAPPISIHISWDRTETGAVAAALNDDPRMSRADITSERGGLDGAIVKFSAETPPDLLFIDTTLSGTAMFKALARLRSVLKPETRLVVIGALNDVSLFRELAARGVSEYMLAPVQPAQMATAACALFAETDSSRVIAVIGARGGVGASTIARNLAWSIAEQHQIPAALVDLDLSFGTAAFDAHVETPRSVAELLDTEDAAAPERVAARCTERLRIIRAPTDLRREDEPNPEALERMVRAVRRLSPFVILDLPHSWSAWVRQALIGADDVIVVASPDLASLRNGEAMLRLLKNDRGERAEPIVALSMVGVPKRPEITFKDFSEALKSAPVAAFGFEPELFGLAALKGQMAGEIAPRSKTAESFTKLASLLTGREPPKQKKKDLRALLVAETPEDALVQAINENAESADEPPLDLVEQAPPVAEYILRARQAAEAELISPTRQREEPQDEYKPPFGWLKVAACVLALCGAAVWYARGGEGPPTASAAVALPDSAPPVVIVAQPSNDRPARYEAALELMQSGQRAEAVALLREVAEENYAPAQYRLAKAYELGEGVETDLAAARQWTERAANGGNVRAMHDLGVYYAMGDGAPANEAAAFRWFRQAAEFGVADSQYNLGLLYQQGRGVTASADEALFWFTLAAQQGDQAARERAGALEAVMTDVQADQARARAQAFAARTPDPRANAPFQVMQAETAGGAADAPS